MLSAYRELAAAREAQDVPALPLNAEQTQGLTELLQNPPAGEEEFHPHGEHQERRARHVHSGEEATVACADPDYSLFVGDHDS